MHCSNTILLVKPAHFGYNTETAASNTFQKTLNHDSQHVTQNAIHEFEQMVQQLTHKGIHVIVIPDTPQPIKPDAIFPNNWISFHADGTVVLYPMLAQNRRPEKRPDILQTLSTQFNIKQVIDLSPNEATNTFLEGTGSIIFDHTHKIAYACLAPRTDKALFLKTSQMLGYQPIAFQSNDRQGQPIYHTNVMMSIGNTFAVICLDSLTNPTEKQQLINTLQRTQKEIIDISYTQLENFCGNLLELHRPNRPNIIALSQSAFTHLTPAQKATLQTHCELVPLNVETIERIGGGSVRCMIAEIFLPQKTNSTQQTPPN